MIFFKKNKVKKYVLHFSELLSVRTTRFSFSEGATTGIFLKFQLLLLL